MSQSIDKLLTALKLSEELVNIECSVLTDTIAFAKDVTDIVARERQKITATNINVIDAAARGNLKETGHSRVLYNLLKNKNICTHFIEKLLPGKVFKSIKLDDKITEGVDREKQNIDISIFADPYFIIIENKVNGAEEQPGQIYRYVQYGLQKTGKDKIYVLYLNKDTRDLPTFKSLNKEGNEYGEAAFPNDEIKEQIIPLSYKNDIYNWISNVYENEKNKYENVKEDRERNEFLFSALVQYKDYLENFFELTDKYEPMKKEINEYLIEKLDLKGKSNSEKIKILENQIENAEKLSEKLKELKFLIVTRKLHQEFNERFSDEEFNERFSDARIKKVDYTDKRNEPMFGIVFSYRGIKMYCCAGYEDYKCWYGMKYCNSSEFDCKLNNEIKEHKLIENSKSDKEYPIWNWSANGNVYDTSNLLEKTFELAMKIIDKIEQTNSGFGF